MEDQDSYITAVKNFNRYIERKHLRKTPERFAIFKKAWQQGRHFTVDELHAALESDSYHVSRATVYNTMELLLDCGVIARHQFGSGESVYEPAGRSHLHLVCTRCGKVREADDKDGLLEQLLSQRRFAGFEPAFYSASVFGICSQCSRKLRKEEQKGSAGAADSPVRGKPRQEK